MQSTHHIPRIRMVPPVYFAVWVGAGFLLNLAMPAVELGLSGAVWGWGLIMASMMVNLWSVSRFKRASTPMHVKRSAVSMVTDGPYRFSRNPLYLSMLLGTMGFGFVANQFWLLALTPLFVVVFNRLVIEPEEHYLADRFGADYLAYVTSVRRWV